MKQVALRRERVVGRALTSVSCSPRSFTLLMKKAVDSVPDLKQSVSVDMGLEKAIQRIAANLSINSSMRFILESMSLGFDSDGMDLDEIKAIGSERALLEKKLFLLGAVIHAINSLHPSQRTKFLEFVSQKDFDIFNLITTLGFFSQRRELNVQKVPPELIEEAIKITRDGESLGDLSRFKTCEELKEYLFERGIFLYPNPSLGVPPLYAFNRFFDIGEFHGFYLVPKAFGILNGGKKGKGLMLPKDKSIVLAYDAFEDTLQHELQHLFDHLLGQLEMSPEAEFRAYLASVLFSDNPQRVYERLKPIGIEVLFRNNATERHSLAKLMLYDHFEFVKTDPDKMRKRAENSLDAQYKELCGISYGLLVKAGKLMKEHLEAVEYPGKLG